MKSLAPRAVLVPLLLALVLGGCSSNNDSSDIEDVVRTTILRDVDPSDIALSVPTYLYVDGGPLEVQGLEIDKSSETVAAVSGRVVSEMTIKPQPDKAAFLRVVPASGGTISAVRPFTGQAIKQDGKWIVAEGALVLADEPAPRSLAPQDIEQARQLAVKAMTALFTFDGDVRKYAKAQSAFYATKPASEADFNQSDFDPAPSLDLRNKVGDPVWPRTNDGGKDDLYVGNVFPFAGDDRLGRDDCSKLILRSMRPSTVSAEVTGTPTAGAVEDKVLVSGQTVVRIGDRVCRVRLGLGDLGESRRVGPQETNAEYLLAVSRLAFGGSEWFIAAVDADNESASATLFGGGGPRLYDTGSGDANLLASP